MGQPARSRCQTTGALESEVVASEAKSAAGINITLQTKTFNFLTANYNNANPAAAKYTNDWGVNNYGGLFTDYYPTGAGVWNAPAPGSTSAPTTTRPQLADERLRAQRQRRRGQEGGHLHRDAPAGVVHADPDYLLAVNSKKVGSQPDGWTSMTQQQWFPQYWYKIK